MLSIGSGRLAQLSLDGLMHVQTLGRQSVADIAARLYAWNRLPSSAWRRLGTEPVLVATRAASAAGQSWEMIASGPPATPWCMWRLRGRAADAVSGCWKVYISPHPRYLADVVPAAMCACVDLPVVGLKYGTDVHGMLRPDKLVVHLAAEEAVHLLTDRLLRLLDGCPAQGVPYSAELGGDGLISWGRDPPSASQAIRAGGSWRAWVTKTLAEGFVDKDAKEPEPWKRALDRIVRAGVDPLTWAPPPALWAVPDPLQPDEPQ
jgi:hypothetical protein